MNDLGASQLALGGLTNGVSVVDMAAAYSVFPRNGLYCLLYTSLAATLSRCGLGAWSGR